MKFVRPRLFIVLAAVVLTATAPAEPLQVCVYNLVGLPAPAEMSLRAELRLLFPRMDIVAKRDPCSSLDSAQVSIFVRDTDPKVPIGALGRAPVVDGKILPSLEVFVQPVAELSGGGDLDMLGRALGRIAAHELLHYLLQQSGHDPTGLLQEQLDASALRSEDRRSFVSLIAQR